MLLLLALMRRSRDEAFLRIFAWNPSTRASANIPEALQNRGSRNSILKALLYCTRSAL
jgi:hypothetical protein